MASKSTDLDLPMPELPDLTKRDTRGGPGPKESDHPQVPKPAPEWPDISKPDTRGGG